MDVNQEKKQLGKALRGCDSFSDGISLNLGGNSRYQTRRGGLLTLFISLITIFYSLELLLKYYKLSDPTISSYEVGHIQDGTLNMMQMHQSFQVHVRNKELEQDWLGKLDPRAAKISVYSTTVENLRFMRPVKRERLELTECSHHHYEHFGATNFDTLNKSGFGHGACIVDSSKATLQGVKVSPEFSFLEINLEKCVQADLPAGQQCMTEDEVKAYFKPLGFIVTSMHNFIKYSDIGAPFKSLLKPNVVLFLDPTEKPIYREMQFAHHSFMDNTSRFQLLSESVDTEYLSLYSIESNSLPPIGQEDKYAQLIVSLNEIHVLESRHVYDSLDLFGDIGGILTFMLVIGRAFKQVFTGNEQPMALMRHYYRYQEDTDKKVGPTEVATAKNLHLDCMTVMSFSSILRFLPWGSLSSCCQRQSRQERLLKRADQQMDRVLDVRNLLRSHGLLRTVLKTVYPKKHSRTLLKLQRHQRIVDPGKTDSDSVAFYSSSDDARAVKDFIAMEGGGYLSPRSQALRYGISPQPNSNPRELAADGPTNRHLQAIDITNENLVKGHQGKKRKRLHVSSGYKLKASSQGRYEASIATNQNSIVIDI